MSKKRKQNSELAELVQDGLILLVFGLVSKTPWLKSLSILLIIVGVIFVVYRIALYFRIKRPLDIFGVDEMSGADFERLVEKLLKVQGYEVNRIGGYEDYGVDLIASRGGRKHAIQVKRWKRPVGMDAIRAAVAGMAFHNCDRAVVITSSYFSWRAKNLAKANNCKLIDRNLLAQQVKTYRTMLS
jgi:restriction system protein